MIATSRPASPSSAASSSRSPAASTRRVVAALAHRALGDKALAVTAVSPAVATGELDGARARRRAHRHRARDRQHRRARAPRLPRQRRRPLLLLQVRALRRARRAGQASAATTRCCPAPTRTTRATGAPACKAAAEHGVVHPLHDVDEGRRSASSRAPSTLPSAEKPASPCLASRIPYGTAVDPETLALIDRAERAVKALGFPVLRVRHHGIMGRLEVDAERPRPRPRPRGRRSSPRSRPPATATR